MIWFFVLAASSCLGVITMYPCYNAQAVELRMPSQEACQQVVALNRQGECWAKPETKP